ncbi:MAG: glycosyltransferase family 39 protein, partial [Chloroflexota bacterium]
MKEKTRAAGGFTLTITVETALYLVAVLVALAARLGDLGGRPLQESEAVAALAAWQAHRGLPLNLAGASSLVVLFDVIFFSLFGGGDAAARLAPALFGTALVAMPYFLRDFLGRRGAIFASFVFALSPSFVYFSRFSSGSIIAVFAGLGAALAWQRYRKTGGTYYAHVGALALALLVTSYPGAYTLLAAFALYAAYGTRSGWLDLNDLARRPELRGAGVVFALAAVGIATGLLYYLPGVQTGLVDLLAGWAQGLWPLGGSLPWYYHLELLVIYEPLVAIL